MLVENRTPCQLKRVSCQCDGTFGDSLAKQVFGDSPTEPETNWQLRMSDPRPDQPKHVDSVVVRTPPSYLTEAGVSAVPDSTLHTDINSIEGPVHQGDSKC